MKKKAKRKPKVKSWQGYAILNRYKEPWTTKVFETVGEAELYMTQFWGFAKNPPDMSKHKIVPVKIKIL